MSMIPMISRVWNDNDYIYREKYNEQDIVISPKKFIEMEHLEAVRLIGRYVPIIRDTDGQPMKEHFKMLRIERTSKPVSQLVAEQTRNDFTCQACRFKAKTQEELNEHSEKEHRHMWADEEEAERKIKNGNGKAK